MTSRTLLFTVLTLASTACAARSPEMYEADTRKVLQGQTNSIKSCYDGVLKKDKSAKGTVVVTFIVAEETGAIASVKADADKSTAPADVQACVVENLSGLKIDPPDAREGQATFTWQFEINPQS